MVRYKPVLALLLYVDHQITEITPSQGFDVDVISELLFQAFCELLVWVGESMFAVHKHTIGTDKGRQHHEGSEYHQSSCCNRDVFHFPEKYQCERKRDQEWCDVSFVDHVHVGEQNNQSEYPEAYG